MFMCPKIVDIGGEHYSDLSNAELENKNLYISYGWSDDSTMLDTNYYSRREIILNSGDSLQYYYEQSGYYVEGWDFMIIEEDLGVQ